MAVGGSQIQKAAPFFGANAPDSLGIGTGLNFTFAHNFSQRKNGFLNFHLGLQHRVTSASESGGSYSLQSTYLMMRLHFPYLFFSFGGSPFIWNRYPNARGESGPYRRAAGATGYLGEVGVELPITPAVSFGLTLGGETISQTGSSPSPAIQGTMNLRFYIDSRSRPSDEGAFPDGYEGWRYPYGNEIRR